LYLYNNFKIRVCFFVQNIVYIAYIINSLKANCMITKNDHDQLLLFDSWDFLEPNPDIS